MHVRAHAEEEAGCVAILTKSSFPTMAAAGWQRGPGVLQPDHRGSGSVRAHIFPHLRVRPQRLLLQCHPHQGIKPLRTTPALQCYHRTWNCSSKKKKEEISKGVRGHAYFYFFLPLVPVGVVGRYSCQSAARRVAWRRDILWVLRVSATELLHCFLGLPLALQPEYLVLFARKAGWFMGMLPWKIFFF